MSTPTNEQRVMAELAAQRNNALDALAQVAAELAATRAELEAERSRAAEAQARVSFAASNGRRHETGEMERDRAMHDARDLGGVEGA